MCTIIYVYNICAASYIVGYVLKEAPFDAWVNGRGNDVPLLIGKPPKDCLAQFNMY